MESQDPPPISDQALASGRAEIDDAIRIVFPLWFEGTIALVTITLVVAIAQITVTPLSLTGSLAAWVSAIAMALPALLWWRSFNAVYVSERGIFTRDHRYRRVTMAWTDDHRVGLTKILGFVHMEIVIPSTRSKVRIAVLAGTAARFVAAVEACTRTCPDIAERYRQRLREALPAGIIS